VLAKNKKEYRILKRKGRFYIYNYKDMNGRETEKYSLVLLDDDGRKEKWIVIPLRDNRLLVTKREEINQEIWVLDNDKEKRIV